MKYLNATQYGPARFEGLAEAGLEVVGCLAGLDGIGRFKAERYIDITARMIKALDAACTLAKEYAELRHRMEGLEK